MYLFDVEICVKLVSEKLGNRFLMFVSYRWGKRIILKCEVVYICFKDITF